MKLFSQISKIALHLSAIFLFSTASWGQKDVLELLPGAYKLIYNESTYKNIEFSAVFSPKTPVEEIANNLSHRDNIDSNREDSPLKKADDAILFDNSDLTREVQLQKILKLVELKNNL